MFRSKLERLLYPVCEAEPWNVLRFRLRAALNFELPDLVCCRTDKHDDDESLNCSLTDNDRGHNGLATQSSRASLF